MFCLSKLNRNNTCLLNSVHRLPPYCLFFFLPGTTNKHACITINFKNRAAPRGSRFKVLPTRLAAEKKMELILHLAEFTSVQRAI